MVVVLLVSWPSAGQQGGGGAGVCRDPGCCPFGLCGKSGPPSPLSSCQHDADALRARYHKLTAEMSDAFKASQNPTNTKAKDRLSELYDEMNALRKQWEALRAKCLKQGVDIGALDGDEQAKQVDQKSDEQRKQENKDEARRIANVMDTFATEGKVEYAAGVIAFIAANVYTMGLESVGEGGAEAAGSLLSTEEVSTGEKVVRGAIEAGKQVGEGAHNVHTGIEAYENYEAMVTGWQEGAEAWHKAAHDPPSHDYESVVVPALPPAASQPKSVAGRALAAAGTARRQADARIRAWVISYERYQGARAAHDTAAMTLQAAAMERFAQAALAEARAASSAQRRFDIAYLAMLQRIQAELSARGLTWDSVLGKYRTRARAAGISPAAHRRLAAAGWPAADAAALDGTIAKLNAARITQSIATLQTRLGTEIRNLPPEPPDLHALEGILRFSALLPTTGHRQENSGGAGSEKQGRLSIVFPSGPNVSGTIVSVFRPGGSAEIEKGIGGASFTLPPGRYDVKISNVRLSGIEVRAGRETALRPGVLHVVADNFTTYQVLDPAHGNRLRSGYGESTIGLPAGTYRLRIHRKLQTIRIQEGKVTEIH